jgi:HSP20 family protein
MKLARRDRETGGELMPLRDMMNRLMEESFIWPSRVMDMWWPGMSRSFPVDVFEADNKYVVEAALPGMKPDDIQVSAREDMLTIQVVQKPEERTVEGRNYVRRERYEGEMIREITLPGPIEADKVAATYEHGVLKLEIPKTEAAQTKRIPIRVSGSSSAVPAGNP